MKKSDRTQKRVEELILALKLVELQEEMEKEEPLWEEPNQEKLSKRRSDDT
ncbi:hypothetical protein ACFLS7_06835 [Bacteroidota bacterium]